MSKIAVIFGSGARIGQASAKKFLSAGYKVATVSRTPQTTSDDDLVHLTADLQDPSTIEPIFDQVQQRWGAPSVVVYNAYGMYPTGGNPLSAPINEFTKTLSANTISAYAAASASYKRNNQVAFFYTGNALNTTVMPTLVTLGVGKTASAHWIEAAAKSEQLRPARFYYIDQRNQAGAPAGNAVNGEAHADLFLKLAEQKEQGEPIVVFKA
ncbi:hypothetical protein I302_104672 [Kwoniella bestiolae CBS 10118]|uniref:Short-chain dehydrogenase n=1 Tax=Kwoniella bestiolae CBS 10118 TaxID=1296100 RepID=A0AAJ8M8W9_9TREE